MPDLIHSLRNADLGFLKIVAYLWRIDVGGSDARLMLPELAKALMQPGLAAEVIEALPEEAQQALTGLVSRGGRIPWAAFTRRYGPVREMGPARRDREQPYLKPVSAVEALWYRGLVGRDFFPTPGEPQEYAYIPDDLLPLLPAGPGASPDLPGSTAAPELVGQVFPANDRLLDRACTRLAALRLGQPELGQPAGGISGPALQALLETAGLLDPAGAPLPEPARAFLEAPRGQAMAQLTKAWLESTSFNELRLLPGLKCEGGWTNDPLAARRFILDQLACVPADTWWDLSSFVQAIREQHPDFQRPAGDYDSWFIRRESDGAYLRGYEHWEEIDGALIRFVVAGMLHWLGVVDLARPVEGGPAAAFCLSGWAEALLDGRAPEGLAEENGVVRIAADGRLRCGPLLPRAARYLIARFCAWEGEDGGETLYRLTPASLEVAKGQGLKVSHLVTLLKRHTAEPLPPKLVQSLERWEQSGVQARLEPAVILRLKTPEILNALRGSSAARFLGDVLGPTAVIVKPGARRKVIRALEAMGYLVDEAEEGPGGTAPQEKSS